jgi:hypothetical protein
MIQIPFTAEHDIKENTAKQTRETYNAIADNIMCDSTSHGNCPYLL